MAANTAQWTLLTKAAKKLSPTDFGEYFELRRLLASRQPVSRREFQTRFANYYRINRAFLGQPFQRKYFQLLFAFRPRDQKDPYSSLLLALYRFPRFNGDHSLQASFVSKLVAIHEESHPLYDVHVSKFFGLALPSVGPIEFRIAGFVANLQRIQVEYEAWAKAPNFKRIVKPLLHQYPLLRTCHSTRLCDFLVWSVGHYKIK